MSDLHRKIVVKTFETEDDAIRAVQGLRMTGFEMDDITIAGRNPQDARRVAEQLEIEVTDEWPDNGKASEQDDLFRLVVKAGDRADFARRVMVDGILDATGLYADIDDEVDLDDSPDVADDDYPT